MERQEKETRPISDLSKYIKRSPHWAYLFSIVLVLVGIYYFLLKNFYVVLVGVLGAFIILIGLDYAFSRLTNTHFPMRRIIFLDFVSFLVTTVFFIAIYFARVFSSVEIMLMVSISSATLLRVLIFYTYYSDSPAKFIVPSLNYTYGAVFSLTVTFREWIFIIPFFISSIIYIAGGIVFVKSSTREFNRQYGISATKIIQMFLNYGNNSDGNGVGEEFFKKIYRHVVRVPVKVLDVVRLDGGRMVTMVFPYVHPGPFGSLGSSDLPIRLQRHLSDIGADLMVFHTTTTNSNNCAGEEDIAAISNGVRAALKSLNYEDTISRFKKISVGKYVIGMQKFGSSAVGSIIPEKEPFDDVVLKEGLKLMHHVERFGIKHFAVIDAQNNFVEKNRALDNCAGMDKAFVRELKRLESKHPALMGYYRIYEPVPGLGAMGIQAIVTQAGDKFQAIVLTDSNNVTLEVMERSREAVANIVNGLEIYTTDNHVVNASNLDVNPLGQSGDVNHIVSLIARCVEMAKKSTVPV
ncbi:MAG: DUF2070 family protein, partial [Thermoplasmataceae archaeon]